MTVRIEPMKALRLSELPISEATKVSAARSPRGMTGMVVQSIGITMLLLALRTDVVPHRTRSGLNLRVASSGTPPRAQDAMPADCGAAKASPASAQACPAAAALAGLG